MATTDAASPPAGQPPASARLPNAGKLRQILALLGMDARNIPLSGMTTERQQTALAYTAAATLMAKLCNHIQTDDPLTDAERYMASVSSVADVAGGDGPSGLAMATFLNGWSGDVVSEVTRHDDGSHSPGPAIRQLVLAAGHLISAYVDAHRAPGFEVDGQVYRVMTAPAGITEALEEMREAAELLGRLLPAKDRP